MSAVARLAAFAAALVVAGALGAGIGAAVGPLDVGSEPHSTMTPSDADPTGDAPSTSSAEHGSAHPEDGS